MSTVANDTPALDVRTGLALALGAAFSFGMSGAWARGLMDAGWSPGAAVAVRMWVAAIVLLVPTLLALRGRWGVVRKNAGMILVYGLIAVTAAQLCFFQAVAVMDVGIALLIEYTAPIAVVLWLWIRRGERPGARGLVGAAIAFVGLLFMLEIFTGSRIDPVGVLWALGAMVGAATYFLLSGKSDTGLPPIALAGLGLLAGSVGLSVAGVTGALHMAWSTTDVVYRFGTLPWFVPVVAVGVIATALAYVLGVVSTRRLGSRFASFVALSEVIAALLFGWLFLGQLPDLLQAFGVALVLVGVVLVKLGEPVTDEAEPDAAPSGAIVPSG